MAFWWLLSVYWFNQSNKRSNPSTPLYERISCIFYLCSVPKIEIPTLLTGIYCISPSYQSTIVLYLKQIILVTQHTKFYDEACCFGILLLVYKTKLPFYHVVIHTLLSSKWLLAPSRLHTCQNGALRDGQWCPPPPPPPPSTVTVSPNSLPLLCLVSMRISAFCPAPLKGRQTCWNLPSQSPHCWASGQKKTTTVGLSWGTMRLSGWLTG